MCQEPSFGNSPRAAWQTKQLRYCLTNSKATSCNSGFKLRSKLIALQQLVKEKVGIRIKSMIS